jgi:hypothetical protein
MLPLERAKPPNAKSKSSVNNPNVLAIIIFLPNAAISRRPFGLQGIVEEIA